MTNTLITESRGWRLAILAAASLACVFASPFHASAQTALPPPAATTAADIEQNRIEALERQLREATADNERLQFQLVQAQREVARLQQVTGDLAAANSSLQTPAAPVEPPAAISPRPSAAPRPTTPGQSSSLGTLAVPPGGQALGSSSQPPVTQAASAPTDPAAAYGAARQLLLNGQTAEAEVAFTQFLRDHGGATTAPDARYWLAFTYLARNNYQSAAAGFVDYLQRYPTGPRAPEAQVRLGMALVGLGQTRQGCAAFRDMPTRYPRASQAARDLATREARAASCAA